MKAKIWLEGDSYFISYGGSTLEIYNNKVYKVGLLGAGDDLEPVYKNISFEKCLLWCLHNVE